MDRPHRRAGVLLPPIVDACGRALLRDSFMNDDTAERINLIKERDRDREREREWLNWTWVLLIFLFVMYSLVCPVLHSLVFKCVQQAYAILVFYWNLTNFFNSIIFVYWPNDKSPWPHCGTSQSWEPLIFPVLRLLWLLTVAEMIILVQREWIFADVNVSFRGIHKNKKSNMEQKENRCPN